MAKELKQSPIHGIDYLHLVIQDESQDILNPRLIDAVMAEWNPRAAEQLRRTSSLRNQGKPYVKLRSPELLESRNYEGR